MNPIYTKLREAWAVGMRSVLRILVHRIEYGIRKGWLDDDAKGMLQMHGVIDMFDRHEKKAKRVAIKTLRKLRERT